MKKQEIKSYQKITMGFVVQNYVLNENGKYICHYQSFEAGDEVSRENEDAEKVKVDVSKEVYQHLDMVQPDIEEVFNDWYVENKHHDSLQKIFHEVLKNNPDYELCFRDWCRKYYRDCVDI